MLASLYAGQGIAGTAIQAAVDGSSQQSPADKLVDHYGFLYGNWLLGKDKAS